VSFFTSISWNLHLEDAGVGDNLGYFLSPMRHVLFPLLGLMRRRVWLLGSVLLAAIVSIVFHSWTASTPILLAGLVTYVAAQVHWVVVGIASPKSDVGRS
jgi:hypothetical protein